MQSIAIKETANSKGFTFIEVMISLAILSIGILAVISMQVSSSKGVRNAGEASEAISLATLELERLMSLSYADLTNTGITPADATVTVGTGNKFSIRQQVSAGTVANTTSIIITASWNLVQAGIPTTRTIELTSIKPNLNI